MWEWEEALVKNEFLREKKWGNKRTGQKVQEAARIANRPTNQFSPGALLFPVVKSAQHTLH